MATMNRAMMRSMTTMDGVVRRPRYLLGVADDEITANSRHLATWNTSKIGGRPDFMTSDSMGPPRCRICDLELTLVVQVYAPLDDDDVGGGGVGGQKQPSSFHRTLYVFACIGCWRRTGTSSASPTTARTDSCWRVLRSQLPVPDEECGSPNGEDKCASNATDWLSSADDWIAMDDEDVVVSTRSPRILQQDCRRDFVRRRAPDDSSDDDALPVRDKDILVEHLWTTEQSSSPNRNALDGERLANHVNLDMDEQGNTTRQISDYMRSTVGGGDDEHERDDSDSDSDSLSEKVRSKLHLSDSMEGAVGLSHDCEAELEPPDDDAMSVAITVDTPSLPSRELIAALFAKPETTSSVPVLRSWFLAVVEEPPLPNVAFGDHERELLAAYQRREGMNINDLYSRSQRTETSGGESYEKCLLKHGDREFQKLQRRLRLFPQQLLRYCRDAGASPLLISSATKGDDSLDSRGIECPNCGGEAVFELQILPTAVDFMKADGTQDTVLEFGTVVVYTCRVSCWSSDSASPFVEERAIVIADPDEVFFGSLKRRPE